MNNCPLLSIQCLVYNHEPFLRQCLDGFVMQKTNFSFEAIVHDDASTDGSAGIIREYAEKYPHIIKPIFETENLYSKRDGSLGRIMNEAIHPNAKYIATCEGDDYWIDPYKLQKQVDFLEANPDVTLCFHNALLHFEQGITNRFVRERDENGNPKDRPVKEDMEDRFYSFDDNWNTWFHPTASFVFRKSVLESDYYKNMLKVPTCSGDNRLRYSCARLGKLYSFSDIMSVYRIQPGGVSQNFTNKNAYLNEFYIIKALRLDKSYLDDFCYRVYNDLFYEFINIIRKGDHYKDQLDKCKVLRQVVPICFWKAVIFFPFKVFVELLKKI